MSDTSSSGGFMGSLTAKKDEFLHKAKETAMKPVQGLVTKLAHTVDLDTTPHKDAPKEAPKEAPKDAAAPAAAEPAPAAPAAPAATEEKPAA